jgi:hypothetical protein
MRGARNGVRRVAFMHALNAAVQAAALADADSGSVAELEASARDHCATSAGALDMGCMTADQSRVFRSVMAKLPLTLSRRGPALHALMSELAMWLVVHRASPHSADVLAPLCSAILDCFADSSKATRLEQAAALAATHLCAPTHGPHACDVRARC